MLFQHLYLHERQFDSEQTNSLYLSKKDVFIVSLNILRDFISLVLMSTLFHSLRNVADGKLLVDSGPIFSNKYRNIIYK